LLSLVILLKNNEAKPETRNAQRVFQAKAEAIFKLNHFTFYTKNYSLSSKFLQQG